MKISSKEHAEKSENRSELLQGSLAFQGPVEMGARQGQRGPDSPLADIGVDQESKRCSRSRCTPL